MLHDQHELRHDGKVGSRKGGASVPSWSCSGESGTETETDTDTQRDTQRDRDRDTHTETETDLSNPKSTRAKMVHKRAGGRSGIHGKSPGAENRNRSSTSIRLLKRPDVVEVLEKNPLCPSK